ncbi:MAG TPA: hypothetical protein VFW45_14765 [Candidatus Polarisedimenticolia bacterium]|nr:hypothetical protein [Candidatus Polarisedimenticolia bacterium]
MAENENPDPAATPPAPPAPSTASPAKTSPAAGASASPAPAASAAAPAKAATAAAPVKPTFQIYNRQKDQHVVGPGCWCLPKVEVVDGQKIYVHKRD